MTRKLTPADFQGDQTQTCAMCGEGEARLSRVTQEFEYGSGEGAVTLHALVPVWTCDACDLEYVDAEGEIAQHAAVCRHLGRLSPAEIKIIRMRASLSQKEFADKLQVGSASLKRWESGSMIQNRSADKAIRNFQSERRRADPPVPTFRTALTDVQRAAAVRFQLRLPSDHLAIAA